MRGERKGRHPGTGVVSESSAEGQGGCVWGHSNAHGNVVPLAVPLNRHLFWSDWKAAMEICCRKSCGYRFLLLLFPWFSSNLSTFLIFSSIYYRKEKCFCSSLEFSFLFSFFLNFRIV